MLKLSIRQTGAERILTVMGAIQAASSDISPTFPEMERTFRAQEAEQFATEGGAGATSWPPLSAAYAAWKARHFPGKTILRRTDALFASLVGRGPGSYVEESPRRLVMGTNVPYAIAHQTGRKPRPPISLSDRQAAEYQRILFRYFVGAIRRGLAQGTRVSVQRALVGA